MVKLIALINTYTDLVILIPVSVAFLGPSVTSYQGYNMGFRVYTIDGDYNGTTNVSDSQLPWILIEVNVQWSLMCERVDTIGVDNMSRCRGGQV